MIHRRRGRQPGFATRLPMGGVLPAAGVAVPATRLALFAAGFAVLAWSAGFPSLGAAQEDARCGDVNDSGSVTVADALAVLRQAVGQPVAFDCPAPGALARTGQSMCWSAGGSEINCNGSGQDGELRVGTALDFTDNGDGTITDNVTGLMWEKLSRNGSIHDVGSDYDWNEAFGKIGNLNDTLFAGYVDWRLPNQRELLSLLTFGGAAEQTISGVFRSNCQVGCSVLSCSCTAPEVYWSSTTDPFVPTRAEGVTFGSAATVSLDKNTDRRVRAVRTAD
jgi:hypothetical protein